MGGNLIQFIRDIVRVQGCGKDVLIIMEKKFPGLDPPGRIAHDGDIAGIDTIGLGVFADEPHSPGDI